MDIKVYPGKLKGTVQAPPSKSAAHRALICASLADGTSIIRGISGSKDMKATIGCMSALGAQIERIDDHSVRIVGISAARGVDDDAMCSAGEDAVCGTGEDAACGAGEGVVCGAGEDAVCGVGEGAVCGAGEGAVCGTGEDAVCSAGEDAVCGVDNDAMCNYNGSRVVLDCIESGSTLRFVLPIAAALGADAHFVGQGKLPERPMTPLADEMKKKGIIFSPDGRDCLPFDIHGKLEAGIFKIPGNISSQYFSGLIFALPLLNADSEIVVDGNLESKGYIDLTLKMVEDFGIRIIKTDSGFKVPGNQTYKASDIEIEGDYSQAAFWFVAGALGSDIKVTGLRLDSAQGDKEAVDVLAGFGANVLKSDLQNNDDDIYVCNTKEISRKVNDGSDGSAASDARSTEKDARSTEKDARSAADKMHAADETHTADKMHAADETHTADKMHAADVDSSDIPDVIPVLSVAAACCNGTSTFYNAGRLRLKECDRLSAMAVSLKKLGIEASETENELIVTGGRLRGGCEVSGFNDHRIVMSMAIAALSCEEPVIITGVEAISKSYPDFFDEFRRLGGRADVITDRKDS